LRSGGKTGVPEEKPLGAEKRTNNKLNPFMTPCQGIYPGRRKRAIPAHHYAIPIPRPDMQVLLLRETHSEQYSMA